MTSSTGDFDWQLVERVARLSPNEPGERQDAVDASSTIPATRSDEHEGALPVEAGAPLAADRESWPLEADELLSDDREFEDESHEPWEEPVELLEATHGHGELHDQPGAYEVPSTATETVSQSEPDRAPAVVGQADVRDEDDPPSAEPSSAAVVAAYEARLGGGPLPALLSDIRDETRRINHVLASAGALLDDGQVAMVRLALRPAPRFGSDLDARLHEFESGEPARQLAAGPVVAAAARAVRATARLFVRTSGTRASSRTRIAEAKRPKVIRGSAEERLQKAVRRKLDDGPWFEAALRVLVADDSNVAPVLQQLAELDEQLAGEQRSPEAAQLKMAADRCRRQLRGIEQACEAKARALTESFAPFNDTTQRFYWSRVDGADAAQGLMPPPARRPQMVLSAHETAQLAHVPDDLTEDTAGVLVERSTFKHVPLRRPLYVDDPLRPANGLIPIGQQDGHAIGMPNSQLDRHFALAGLSGTGKSELLLRMCLGIAHANYPMVVIDPHGQLCDDLMNIIVMHCPQRANDITYVDVGSYPVGINPLDVQTEEQIQGAVDATLLIMRDKFQLGAQAPRAVSILEAALYALAEANHRLAARTDHRLNILDLLDFFARDNFRALVMRACSNRASAEWFDAERGRFEKLSQKERDDHTGAIVRGLTRIAANPTFSLPFSASQNKLNFSQLMTGRRIVLLKLARFSAQKAMGEMVASFVLPALLGSMEEWGRKPGVGRATGIGARVVVDEAHAVFADDPNLESTLAEARKFDVGVLLATQFLGQMSSSTQDAVFVNTGSKIAFRNDPQEVSRMAASIAGISNTPNGRDISGLPNYHYFANVLLRDASGPFSARALEPVLKRSDDGGILGLRPLHEAQTQAILSASQATIGTTRDEALRHQREHLRALESALLQLRTATQSSATFTEPSSDQDFWDELDKRS